MSHLGLPNWLQVESNRMRVYLPRKLNHLLRPRIVGHLHMPMHPLSAANHPRLPSDWVLEPTDLPMRVRSRNLSALYALGSLPLLLLQPKHLNDIKHNLNLYSLKRWLKLLLFEFKFTSLFLYTLKAECFIVLIVTSKWIPKWSQKESSKKVLFNCIHSG